LKESFDWKEILSSFIYKVSGKGESNRTWKRPSRRYRDVYPVSKGKSRRTGSKNVTFSIDVSGSMNYEKIIRSVSLLVDFAEEHNVNCEYFFFSSWTSKLYQYEGKQEFVDNLNKNYGGGTSMYAALGSEQLEDIDGLVIISDMEFYDHEAQQLADGEYEHVTFPVALINVEPNSNCRAAEILKQAFTDLDQYAEYK
jgi:uncharacterized protein with von Willebrand factor type A (vWA) domain